MYPSSTFSLTHHKGTPIFDLEPEWWNWETQGTQNPPGLAPVRVRLPPPAPIEYAMDFRAFLLRPLRIGRAADRVRLETAMPPVLGKEIRQEA